MKIIRMFLISILVSAWAMAAVAAPGNGKSAAASGQGHLSLQTVALQEKTTTLADGSKHTEMVPAGRVLPGVAVTYQINYAVVGNDSIDAGAFFTDAIPEHMSYVADTAQGTGTDISFSVDGGKTWGSPATLHIQNADGTVRDALPKDYTDIRWVVKSKLPVGAKGSVSFQAVLQ